MSELAAESFDRPRVERAIVDEVVDQSFTSATIEGICVRAQISRERFDAHYTDLEDAYCQVTEGFRDIIVERLMPTFAMGEPWSVQMRAASYAMLDFLTEDWRRARFLYVEVFNAGERAQLIREEAVELMAHLVDQGRTCLADPGTVTFATAEGIAGSLFNQMRSALERGNVDAEELGRELLYLVMAPYVGVDQALSELERPRSQVTG